jgi:hypothetical protein
VVGDQYISLKEVFLAPLSQQSHDRTWDDRYRFPQPDLGIQRDPAGASSISLWTRCHSTTPLQSLLPYPPAAIRNARRLSPTPVRDAALGVPQRDESSGNNGHCPWSRVKLIQ